MNNWRKVKLSEICLFIDGDRGKNYPTQFDFFDEGYCLFLNASNVTPKGFLFEKKVYLSKEKDDSLRNGKLQLGDIVLTTRGTLGNVALYNDKISFKNVRINSGMVIIRTNKNLVNNYFLYYILISKQIQSLIKNISTGSAQPQIPIKILKNIEIYLPSLDEQKAIAGVLSAFDDKIELNNRIIKNLEEQAQTLYKHWFVDFEFPNKNGQPYKSSGGTFKDSELGEIPTDWEVKEIKDVSARLTQRVKSEKNIKVLSAINKGELELSENVFDKKVFSSKIDNYIIVPPKCFAYNPARANIGSIGMNKFDFTGCVSPVYIAIKFEDSYEWFWEFLIKSKIFRQEIIKRSSGTVRQNFDFESFKLIKVIYPNKNDVTNFNSIYLTIYENIKKLQHENEKLAEMRDYLLPKLMSGKIKVKLEN